MGADVRHSKIIFFTLLLGISSPAHGCGFYGYHPAVQQGSDPWVPLVSFAAIVFGFMFFGRSIPRIPQGVIMGFLFALASALGVFSISIFFYPEAYIAKMLLLPAALIMAVALLGYKSKQELWGLGKYGLGIVIELAFYLPMSNNVPTLKSMSQIEWVSKNAPTTTLKKSTSASQHSKRPVFAVRTQNIAKSARTPIENNENSPRDKD